MGEFRFRIPSYWELESRHVRTVHVVGLDGIPKPCNVKHIDGTLVIVRNQNESGRVYISYPFSERGELTVCTGTLPEASKIYDLATELARGTINRLRNQTSIWQEGGLGIPDRVIEQTKLATKALGRSIVAGLPDKDDHARSALDTAIDAIFLLSAHFGDEVSKFRVSESEIPQFWIGTAKPDVAPADDQLAAAFDFFTATNTDELSTSNSTGQKSIVGPFLDASPHSSFAREYENFQAGRESVLQQVEQTLNSLPEDASLLHAACNLNGVGFRNLSYRQQFSLTSELLELIDNKSKLPVMLSFDHPWAERLAWSVGGIHPLQIADEIIRGGSRVTFLGLDINLDYWPGGSVSRDPLQWIEMIDIWGQLGLPLILCLRVPQIAELKARAGQDELLQTDHSANVTISLDNSPAEDEEDDPAEDEDDGIVSNSVRENLNQDQRMALLETVLPMIAARPGVHGIIWRQWSDNQDPRYPDAGLIDGAGIAGPAAKILKKFQTQTLRR